MYGNAADRPERQRRYPIRYLVDNGIKWHAMPLDFPPWDRVYAFFRRWAGIRSPRPG